MTDLRTKVFTAHDELIFKTLMNQARSLFLKDLELTVHGIVIDEISIAGGEIENLVLNLFGVPKDTTMEMMTYKADGDTIYHPDSYCRDAIGEILTDFCTGDYEIDECYKKF